MLLSFPTCTCSAQFFNAQNNNCKISFRISVCSRQWIGGCQSSGLMWCNRVLNSAFLLHRDFHTRNGSGTEAKRFPSKISSSKALPNGKCSARNTCFYFAVVLFYSTCQSRTLDAVSAFTRSVYVVCTLMEDLIKRQHRSFLFVRRRGK